MIGILKEDLWGRIFRACSYKREWAFLFIEKTRSENSKVKTRPLFTFGEEEKPLIGYTTLELLGFKVNPITRRLEKAIPIEYTER